eukprot:NODE_23776_length_651_cov_16.005725.p1 GENE.NODE_23776_length_651_cov_16.005725~~NODE_23776_length_651_cov_16.005725.p1  ORF type:complete len:113 (+),score=4.38 NODE_23776_length_651_cov_16.005725:238-576(+)
MMVHTTPTSSLIGRRRPPQKYALARRVQDAHGTRLFTGTEIRSHREHADRRSRRSHARHHGDEPCPVNLAVVPAHGTAMRGTTATNLARLILLWFLLTAQPCEAPRRRTLPG